MIISPGVQLGSYQILARVGKGGMGEVFRAHDTRLNRTVAIKVLAPHTAGDISMRQRLEREARAIASLSHPHICHLNDVGQHDGIDFLVMEYLEGETLADRLASARGSQGQALSLEDVLRFAIEMAEALSEAHRLGIVHRDLKPSNVMITRSGVKLLDFGLAKLNAQPAAVGPGVSTVPTRQQPLTEKGTILGTWQYMAPEQLEGKEADARTDIFAFGAVVYEMVTGRKAFEGDSYASLIAAILDKHPRPMSALQSVVPPALDRVIQKCLAKNPDARWQTARDLADELKWIAEARSQPGQRSSDALAAEPRRSTTWRWAAGLAVAIATAAAMGWNLPREDPSVPQIRRFAIEPPADAALAGTAFDLSPDGRHLVYRGRTDRSSQLYLRALDQLEVRALPGTEGGFNPTFSPDGQWVAFNAGGKLKKVSLTSGALPITLSDLTNCCAGGSSFTWLPDDRIILPLIATGLVYVPGQGGTAVALMKPDTRSREIDYHSPGWLPGGKALLMGVHRGAEAFDVAVHRLDTGERRVLVQDAFEPQYVPTGHLVFVRGNTLLAAPFDLDRLELTGPAVAMVENVSAFPDSGAAAYRLADDGSLAYVPAVSLQGRQLVWVDRHGGTETLSTGPRGFGAPSLSPDGRRLAVQIDDASRRDIWIYDFVADALTRATFDGASAAPVWTPDGRRLVFSSTREGRNQIYWQPADGTGQAELLVADEHSVWAGSWSPDSQTLAYTRQPPTDLNDIGLLRLGEPASTTLVVSDEAPEQWPRISPDGGWLAYMSAETGRDEIYVAPLAESGGKRQISTDGGGQPVWSRDGRELFYRNGNRFMVVSVGSLPAVIGKPSELPMPVRPATGRAEFFGHPGYDVASDGRLLVVAQAEEEAAPRQIHVVLNWFEELKRRVPTR